MTQAVPSSREQHLADAMDWLLRLHDAPQDAGLQQAHARWLAQDPAHASAWSHACRTWRLLDAMPAASSRTAPPPHRRPRPPLRWAAVALAACLLVALAPTLALHWQADHLTPTGQTRLITLEDGSRLHLGAASAVATDFSATRRQIRLLRGEVFLDVTPDAQRPFVVRTETLTVTVLGTRFNVSAGPAHHSVAVASGRVRVDTPEGQTHLLTAGHGLSVTAQGQAHPRQLAVEDVGRWRHGQLFVQNEAIIDVAATLQRYQGGLTLIPSPALAARRVTGAYDLTQPALALEHLVTPYQGQVRRLGPALRILTP